MSARRRAFALISIMIVALMYAIPFIFFNGMVGPATLIFWVLISAAYLAIVIIAMRGES